MISALRWAVMRANFIFINCKRQSHKTLSVNHNLWGERRDKVESNWGPSAYQPSALPLGQTSSHYPLTLRKSPLEQYSIAKRGNSSGPSVSSSGTPRAITTLSWFRRFMMSTSSCQRCRSLCVISCCMRHRFKATCSPVSCDIRKFIWCELY